MGIAPSALLPVIATDIGIQAAAYGISAPLHTEKLYDISGSLTYMSCIAVSLLYTKRRGLGAAPMGLLSALRETHTRQRIVSACALLWCSRLGLFLGYRVLSHGKDSRFDKIKHEPLKFSGYWAMQALWILLTALPVFTVNALPVALHARWGALDTFGLAVWGTGFLFELISDWQKLQWQSRIGEERRKKEFINEGLWTLSRHPNYFGEVTLWVGNWIMCASAYRQAGFWVGLKSASILAISPIFVASLICGLSGIPILEKTSDKKFGDRADYKTYKEQVPVFVPRLPSLSKSEKQE